MSEPTRFDYVPFDPLPIRSENQEEEVSRRLGNCLALVFVCNRYALHCAEVGEMGSETYEQIACMCGQAIKAMEGRDYEIVPDGVCTPRFKAWFADHFVMEELS